MDIQRELKSLTGDATTMVERVNKFDAWGRHFNMRSRTPAQSGGDLKIGLAAMSFYESEFAAISRQAAMISGRASGIRSQIESLLN